MRQIGACFVQGPNRIMARHGAVAEPGDLGEDEPHPVTMLRATVELGQSGVIAAGLSGDEAVEIVYVRRRTVSLCHVHSAG